MKKYLLIISLLLSACSNKQIDLNNNYKYQVVDKYKNAYNATVHIDSIFIGIDNKLHQASGSGFFVLNKKNLKQQVLTAAHVVGQVPILIFVSQCMLPILGEDDCEQNLYKVRNINNDKDLALLESEVVAKKNGQEIKLSNLLPKIGEDITVIGSPMGLPHSIYTGVLASVILLVEPNRLMYQFTAPITNGNSGGPILNVYNELIGIVDLSIGTAMKDDNGNIIGHTQIPGMNYAIALPEIVKFLQEDVRKK